MGGGSSWVGVYAWLRHGLPGLASSFLRPFIVPPVVSVFALSDAWNWLGSIPSTAGSPGEPVGRGVDLLPPGWDGRFPGGGVFGDAPRSTPSSGCSSPFGLRLVYRLARSPRLLFLELLPRSGSGWLRGWPPVPFILRLPGLLGDCGFADV